MTDKEHYKCSTNIQTTKNIINDYLNGVAVKCIIEKYKLSQVSLYGILHDNKINMRCNRRFWKLDGKIRQRILDMYQSGETYSKISGELCVSSRTILDVVKKSKIMMRVKK